MNREQIQALQDSYPEAFAEKRAAGLTTEQAAAVILAQIEHNKANPPHLIAVAKARSLTELAQASITTARAHIAEAEKARAAALDLDPDADLPELISPDTEDEDDDDTLPLLEALAKREQEIVNLGAETTELREGLAKAELSLKTREAELAKLHEAHQVLLTQYTACGKERDELVAQVKAIAAEMASEATEATKPKKK